ncbi:MAG: hypothetical protein AB7J13_00910, partial [Pyrinomonadaceae bacterium]
MKRTKVSRRILCVMFFTSLVWSGLPLLGQAPKGRAVASSKPAAGKKCSGAWTGVVRYSRTQSMSDNKTVERVSG